jgi:hypothetical protein
VFWIPSAPASSADLLADIHPARHVGLPEEFV